MEAKKGERRVAFTEFYHNLKIPKFTSHRFNLQSHCHSTEVKAKFGDTIINYTRNKHSRHQVLVVHSFPFGLI